MSATTLMSLNHLLLRIGLGLFLLGAAGDIAHHALPHHLTHALAPLLGPESGRAHLVTLLGMFAVVVSLCWKGVSRSDYNHNH